MVETQPVLLRNIYILSSFPDQQYQYVIDDLNKVFNLKAEILEEPVICAVLQEHPALRKDGNYVVSNRDASGDTVTFTSIDNLIYSIRDCLKYYPTPVSISGN